MCCFMLAHVTHVGLLRMETGPAMRQWPCCQVCFDPANNLYLVDNEDSQIVYLDSWMLRDAQPINFASAAGYS